APGGDAGGPALAYYRDGIRVGGSALAPEAWPAWLVAPDRTSAGIVRSPYVALPNGHPALAVTAVAADRDGHRRAVLALIDHEVEEQLAERTGLWVRLLRSDDPQKRSTVRLSIAGRTFSLVPVGAPD